jgi:hypothetical protein
MGEELRVFIRVLIVVVFVIAALVANLKYVPWPEPVALGKFAVAILLLILMVWLGLTWGFGVSMPA